MDKEIRGAIRGRTTFSCVSDLGIVRHQSLFTQCQRWISIWRTKAAGPRLAATEAMASGVARSVLCYAAYQVLDKVFTIAEISLGSFPLIKSLQWVDSS